MKTNVIEFVKRFCGLIETAEATSVVSLKPQQMLLQSQ
jgi:hypothetical protein